jgi:lipopolysaccharide export system permease protein
MHILRSYILRSHLVPFLLGFGVVTFILEMDVLFDYLDLVVNRGVAPQVVALLFLLSLGYIVALSVPCAVLVAVLMTFGRLSQDNEITALRAAGINVGSILIGPISAAFLVAVGLTLFNNHVLPGANHAFANLLIDIGRMRPTVKLQEGVFITDFPGYNLLVRSVNGRTNEMRGVTILQAAPDGAITTILADRGTLSYTPDGRTAVLVLKDGQIHEIPAEEGGPSRYHHMVFKTHVIHVAGAGGILERTVRDSRTDREMSARSLIEERDKLIQQYKKTLELQADRLKQIGLVDPESGQWILPRRRMNPIEVAGTKVVEAWQRFVGSYDPANAVLGTAPQHSELELFRLERESLRKRIAGLSVEIHKKFSLPAACVVFVLIGAPLGMRVRRAGPGVAFISIAFFLFYYLCLVGGEELANRLLLPPWLSMWIANLVLGAWGVLWTLKACELRWSTARPAEPLRAAA